MSDQRPSKMFSNYKESFEIWRMAFDNDGEAIRAAWNLWQREINRIEHLDTQRAELNQENDRLEEANKRLHKERNEAIAMAERNHAKLGDVRGSLVVQIDANKALTAEVTRLREELTTEESQYRDLIKAFADLRRENEQLRTDKADADDYASQLHDAAVAHDQAREELTEMTAQRNRLKNRIAVMSMMMNGRHGAHGDYTNTGRMIARPVGDGSGSYLIESVSASIQDSIDAVNAAQSEVSIGDAEHYPYAHSDYPRPQWTPDGEFVAHITYKRADGLWASGIDRKPATPPLRGHQIECFGQTEQEAQDLRDRVLEALCSK